MSRTVRRMGSKVDRWYNSPWSQFNRDDEWLKVAKRKFHTDAYWEGKGNKYFKELCNKDSRARDRLDCHHLMKDPDYDHHNSRKCQKKYIWVVW